ncbi:HNH endonuclease [Micromonospora sp. STR1s_5]|nr:HNH endonuclease [Micromonospora sp. STR1s_5]
MLKADFSDVERFWAKVQKQANGCWRWTGMKHGKGYGKHSVGSLTDGTRGEVRAHRFSYALHYGPIPAGMTVDHECHNQDPTCRAKDDCPHRLCVNPEHLELRTQGDNMLRGKTIAAANAAKTHCPKGHPYDEANTYVSKRGRNCRACHRASMAAQRRAKK